MAWSRRFVVGAMVVAAVAARVRAEGEAPPTPRGGACDSCDVNCDGANDGRDVQAFVVSLMSGQPAGCSACAGDLNGVGGMTVEDIGPLVSCLLGAHVVQVQDGCLRIVGTAATTVLGLRLRFGVPAVLDVDVGNDGVPEFSFDRGAFDCIVIDARGGNDTVVIDEANGVFTDTELTTIFGGSGNDSFFGGSGGETYD